MTPVVEAVYRELLRRARQSDWAADFIDATERFLDRTGRFAADDPRSSPRWEAALEDALCRSGGERLALLVDDPAEQQLARLVARSHRGLFAFEHVDGELLLVDWLGAAVFVVDRGDSLSREVRGDNLGGLCQARVMGGEQGVVVLPGVVFHDATATEPIRSLLGSVRDVPRDELCDALLYMDYQYRTLSRVKPSYAYHSRVFERWRRQVGAGFETRSALP